MLTNQSPTRPLGVQSRVLVQTGQPGFDGPGTITSVGPKNFVVKLDERVRPVRVNRTSCTPLTDEALRLAEAAKAAAESAPLFVPRIGQVVRFTAPLSRAHPELYVVFGFGNRGGNETVKVIALGGNPRNQYVHAPAFPASLVDANGEVL